MKPAKKVEEMTKRAAESGKVLAEVRSEAREATIELLRDVEERVRVALRGSTLTGLPSLLPPGCKRFPGAKIHGNGHHGIASYLAADGRPSLVWSVDGSLVWAWKDADGGVQFRGAHDHEIAAQDLEPALRAMLEALELHVRRAERGTDDYRAITDLAARMTRALNS